MNQICRLCFIESPDVINIFDKNNGVQLNIPEILTRHFWFKVKENDNFSNYICNGCWRNTEEFHKFYVHIEIIQNYDRNFVNIIGGEDSKNWLVTESLNENIKNEFQMDVLTNVNSVAFVKVQEDEMGYDSATNQLTTSMNYHGMMSKEDILILEDDAETLSCNIFEGHIVELPNTKCKIKSNQKRKSPNDAKRSNSREGSLENENNTDEMICTSMNKSLAVELKETPPSIIDDNNTDDKNIRKQQRELEDKQMCEYFNMVCELCECKFITFIDAKKHYREEHNSKGYLSCCQRKFFFRNAILEHIQCHLNPETYKCIHCDKLLPNPKALRAHIDTRHIPSDEKPFKCEQCPKTFSKEFQLKHHVKYRHYVEEDKKFRCDECGKCFMSKHILQQHVKGIHELSNLHICDICAKVFKSKYFMELHRKSHFANLEQKIQCTLCNKWLMNKRGLQKHMRSHNDTVQICPKCGHKTPNKSALRNHINYMHSAERTHVCHLCDKAFKKSIALKEHIASHTGQSLYTCPHCPQTFNSNANKHSHRKKVHPIEWKEDRLKRGIITQ